MHIPPYHKKRSYQIFLLGAASGTVVAYILLLFMYGKMYEHTIYNQLELETELHELEAQHDALLEEQEEREEESSAMITSLQIEFINAEELKFDRLITLQIEDLVKKELDDIIGKSIQSVSDSDELLVTIIENKTFTIDDLSFQFEVKKISISERVKLSLEGEIAD